MQIGECCKFLIFMQPAQGIPVCKGEKIWVWVVLWILLLSTVSSLSIVSSGRCCVWLTMSCAELWHPSAVLGLVLLHLSAFLHIIQWKTSMLLETFLQTKDWIRVQKTQLDTLVILNCTYLCRNGDSGGDYIINCTTGFWSVQIAIGFQCQVLKQWVII